MRVRPAGGSRGRSRRAGSAHHDVQRRARFDLTGGGAHPTWRAQPMTNPQPVHTQTVDRLRVSVYADRRSLGEAAGADVAARVRALLAAKPAVRMIFAAAPSQNETLAALVRADGIDWSR